MKHQGRGVIRWGDKTDHGAQVISATSETIAMGKVAAIQDELTFCPKCKGKCAIKPDGAGAQHKGTSPATTPKPRPCPPAQAASTAAFSARISVWKAIPVDERDDLADLACRRRSRPTR